jgi:hypothetical protein
MTRSAKPSDFRVAVADLGEFVFGKRTMRDEIASQVEYARMIDGVSPTPWLETVCGAMADLKVLTVRAPEGWDVDDLEPHDPATYAKLINAHRALLNKERSFRPGPIKIDETPGAGAVADDRVPVSPSV